MPTIWPAASYSGPPESPEMIGASISIRPVSFSESWPVPSLAVIDWFSAVTEPVDAVSVPLPPALPTPTIASPTETPDESPTLAVVSPEALRSCSTATSSVGSVPTTSAR